MVNQQSINSYAAGFCPMVSLIISESLADYTPGTYLLVQSINWTICPFYPSGRYPYIIRYVPRRLCSGKKGRNTTKNWMPLPLRYPPLWPTATITSSHQQSWNKYRIRAIYGDHSHCEMSSTNLSRDSHSIQAIARELQKYTGSHNITWTQWWSWTMLDTAEKVRSGSPLFQQGEQLELSAKYWQQTKPADLPVTWSPLNHACQSP